MSLLRHAKTRDASEPGIIAAFQKGGASVQKLDVPADLLVGFLGFTLLVECKNPLGKRGGSSRSALTDDQGVFQSRWRGNYDVVRTPQEAIELLGRVRLMKDALIALLDTTSNGPSDGPEEREDAP